MKKLDFHVHINSPIPLEQTVENFKAMSERFGYDGVAMMSLVAGNSTGNDPECNARALALKKMLPGSFAFASLDHSRDFVDQAKEYMASGFDGIKLLEGKPSLYRYYGYGLDCDRFDAFFEYAEKEQVPMLVHNCDPKRNWDISLADERAIKCGWVYDAEIPPQQHFFDVLEGILKKHPNLRMTVAHMGFYADRLDIASRLLDSCPNLFFDITPALIIYSQLSQNKDTPRFFEKYGDRLIYGTDADNDLTGFAREYNDKKVRIITAFLEGKDPCTVDGIEINPISADSGMLKKIYAENALRFIKKQAAFSGII